MQTHDERVLCDSILTKNNHMKKYVLLVFFAISSCYLFSQITLKREGVVINSTETGIWHGDNIPRTQPTFLTYRNNSITSVNAQGYLLQSGDESPLPINNNLDGQVVTGNKFVWNGVNSETVITHGLFVGYNINSTVKYNYINRAPYAIIFKSGTDDGKNMTFTSGGCAYNICKNGKFAIRLKGINGVKVYNNTFYNGDGSGWYFLLITSNSDRPVKAPSTGAKVFNNIFYSTTRFPMIKIESGCFTGFECDYNVYYCTQGEPTFMIDGESTSWSEWRALGYDTHSVIVNPNFNNATDLVPANRLDYGKNLGTEWQAGLSATATWNVGYSPALTNQNGTWQVGARVKPLIHVTTISLTGAGGATSIITDNGTLQLNASVLPANATNQSFTWSIVNGTGQAKISTSGLVTAVENGTVTALATANDGSGVFGMLIITISNQVTLPVGVDEDKKKVETQWRIIPGSELIIESDPKFNLGKAALYTIQGMLVANRIVESDNVTFNISKFPSGIYLVVLSKGVDSNIVKVLIH